MTQPFKDPYASLDPERKNASGDSEVYRLNVDMSRDDANFIRAIDPGVGVITTTVNLLFFKLVEALKSRGINSYADKQQFQQFVAECTLGATNSPGAGHARQTPSRNDGGRVEGAGEGAASKPNQPASVLHHVKGRGKKG